MNIWKTHHYTSDHGGQRILSRWSSDSEGPTTKWAELVMRHKKLVTTGTYHHIISLNEHFYIYGLKRLFDTCCTTILITYSVIVIRWCVCVLRRSYRLVQGCKWHWQSTWWGPYSTSFTSYDIMQLIQTSPGP